MQDFFGRDSGAVAASLEKDSVNVVPLVREAYEVIIFTLRQEILFALSDECLREKYADYHVWQHAASLFTVFCLHFMSLLFIEVQIEQYFLFQFLINCVGC